MINSFMVLIELIIQKAGAQRSTKYGHAFWKRMQDRLAQNIDIPFETVAEIH